MTSDEKSTKEVLLEQYKVYIDVLNKISQQRSENSRFYITILSGILLILSFLLDKKIQLGLLNYMVGLFALFCVLLCILWFFHIRSYKLLFNVQYSVIKEIETQLSFPVYKREWELITQIKKEKKFIELTDIEQYVALSMIIPYLLLLIISIISILNTPNISTTTCNLTITLGS